MRPSTTSTLLTLLLSSTSVLANKTASPPPYGPYNITQFQNDCIGGSDGCAYDFAITFTSLPAYNSASAVEPAFTTFCSGTDQQSTYVACDDASVSSNVTYTGENDSVVLAVLHSWTVPSRPHRPAAVYTLYGNTTAPEYTGEFPYSTTIYADREMKIV